MATVLVVDDDPQILALLSIALGRAGHEVVTARGGREAIAQALRAHPHLILLDLFMPDLSGRDVLAELRANPELAGTPVVLATGERGSDLQRDVAAVLTKPYKLQELYETVRRVVGDADPAPAT